MHPGVASCARKGCNKRFTSCEEDYRKKEIAHLRVRLVTRVRWEPSACR